MQENSIYLLALEIAKQIAMECLDKEEVDKLLTTLGKLVCVRGFGHPQKQS